MTEVDKIRKMLLRRTPETVEKIRRWKAQGDQAAIDAYLGYAHAPQEVPADESGEDWTPYSHEGSYNWKQIAWMRDNLIGKFCLYFAEPGYDGCELRFERPQDAFAFKMRWG